MFFELVYDENIYDFTEDPIVSYMYKQKAILTQNADPKLAINPTY